MNIAYTKTGDFPFSPTITTGEEGISVQWSENAQLVTLNEAFVKQFIGKKELSEASNIYVLVDKTGAFLGLKQKMAQTFLSKSTGFEYARQNNVIIAAQIYVPFSDSPFSDWVFRFNLSDSQDTPAGAQIVEPTLQAFHDFAYAQFPSVRIKSTEQTANGTKIVVQLTREGVDVSKAGVRIFAKSSSGYLAKTEAFTNENGEASFVAIPLGLEAGDIMKPEFGFKWVTNLVSTEVAA
jgi:hypothetical protein